MGNQAFDRPPRVAHGTMASAFAELLAAELGEASPAAPADGPAPADRLAERVSEAAIERIAARIADLFTDAVLADTVSRIVGDVAERLVREEIARVRAAASEAADTPSRER